MLAAITAALFVHLSPHYDINGYAHNEQRSRQDTDDAIPRIGGDGKFLEHRRAPVKPGHTTAPRAEDMPRGLKYV
jgi:hypothetical protein